MKFLTIIALTTMKIIVRAIKKNRKKVSILVTNKSDELLVDISDGNIIFHEDIKLYIDNNLIS